MKYLNNGDLEDLALVLSKRSLGMNILKGKLEAFVLEDKDFQDGNQVDVESSDTEKDLTSDGGDLLAAKGGSSNSSSNGSTSSSSSASGGGGGGGSSSRSSSASSSEPISGRKRSSSVGGSSSYPSRRPQRKRSSSTGDLSEPSNQRLFTQLVASLGDSFPDYDFSRITAKQFICQDNNVVVSQVNNYLAELNYSNANFLSNLWKAIDFVIDLHHAEIYSYVPAVNDEIPFLEGALWSFNFFFFNKDLMRICYFSCYSISNLRAKMNSEFMSSTDLNASREFGDDDDDDDDDDNDDENDNDYKDEEDNNDAGEDIFDSSANDVGYTLEEREDGDSQEVDE